MKTYTEAKALRDRLEAKEKEAGRKLRELSGGGPMGLTPDAIRATPAWQKARREYNAAFAELRSFNQDYTRRFKQEIASERREKRTMKSTRSARPRARVGTWKEWDQKVAELLEDMPPVKAKRGPITEEEAHAWWEKGMKPETAARRIVQGKYRPARTREEDVSDW